MNGTTLSLGFMQNQSALAGKAPRYWADNPINASYEHQLVYIIQWVKKARAKNASCTHYFWPLSLVVWILLLTYLSGLVQQETAGCDCLYLFRPNISVAWMPWFVCYLFVYKVSLLENDI